ncbi:MAG: amidohydrolase [Alkalilacustris sp.]
MPATRAATATMIITNARVLTMDPDHPRAEAVALAGDQVLAVGRRDEIAPLAGAACQIIDAGGATVMPGFIESHMHLLPGGAELDHLNLLGVSGAAALGDRLRDYAAARPDQPLLCAQQADYAIMGTRAATRADLDAILPDRPVMLVAADHHTAWANTVALQAAGLLQGRRLDPGNEIVMGADGRATGELREFQAFGPVLALAGEERVHLGLVDGSEPDPRPGPEGRAHDRAHLARGLAHCARHGITSIVCMDGNRYQLELLDELRAEGGLTARVRVPFHLRGERPLEVLDEASAMTRDFADAWLASGLVKMFMDGVVDSGTAVRKDDYPGRPGWRGDPLFSADYFAAACTEVDRRGLQIAVHAIGCGAVARTLDGYGAARAANGARDARHRVEHIEMIDRADIPRMADLGVIASVQPCHVPGALDFPAFPTLDMVGRARWRDAFLTATLAGAGIPVAFATDWPVADVNPLRCLKAARVRTPFAEDCADERLELMAGLAAYTTGGAFAEHTEGWKGRLTPGFAADLVILSGDIDAVPEAEIDTLSVMRTVVGGRTVWAA